jgi:hypothetical protein
VINNKMVTRNRSLPKKEQFEGNTIGEQDIGKDEHTEYICSQCNCGPLVIINDKAGNSDRFCRRCGITFSMDDNTVRHRHRLEVPQETEAAISIVNVDYTKDVEIRHPKELRGGIAELQKRGLKITYFDDSSQR